MRQAQMMREQSRNCKQTANGCIIDPLRHYSTSQHFKGALTRNFRPWCSESNLAKFQANILQPNCSNKDIIISHANKNLGSVSVDNIRWALDEHLTDVSTYLWVSEQETQTAATELYTTIDKWTQDHCMCSRLTKDATAYICYWTLKNCSNPFEYFFWWKKSTSLKTEPAPSAPIVHKPHPSPQKMAQLHTPTHCWQPTFLLQ